MKKIIIIQLDCQLGPIVGASIDDNGREMTGIPVIDHDKKAQLLIDQIHALWLSLFKNVEFTNENPAGFEFDDQREKELAPKLLYLVAELVNRLREINDGSFDVEDWASPMLTETIRTKTA